MEGDILYSVKWYKDDLEFYRFVPNDRPKLQVFPQKGIHVDVSKISNQNYFEGYNYNQRVKYISSFYKLKAKDGLNTAFATDIIKRLALIMVP